MTCEPVILRLRDFPHTTYSAACYVSIAAAILDNITTHLRTVAAAVVETVHAPPAMTFLHELHFQMPTATRFTES